MFAQSSIEVTNALNKNETNFRIQTFKFWKILIFFLFFFFSFSFLEV